MPWESTTFRNNGSVVGQTITTPGAMFAQTHGYDALNRLNSITDTARAAMPSVGYIVTGWERSWRTLR